MPADNHAIRNYMTSNRGHPGGVHGRLGDVPDLLYHRTFRTKGGAKQGGELGPVDAPAMVLDDDPDKTSVNEWLAKIYAAILRHPVWIAHEWRKRFIQQPRESVPFIVPSVMVQLDAAGGANDTLAICSFTVSEFTCGFLTHVGVEVANDALWPSIQWSVRMGLNRLNSMVHPNFNALRFRENSLATPLPFAFEIVRSQTVQLVATNLAAAPANVAGVLVGWTEFLADYKEYGLTPHSGLG